MCFVLAKGSHDTHPFNADLPISGRLSPFSRLYMENVENPSLSPPFENLKCSHPTLIIISFEFQVSEHTIQKVRHDILLEQFPDEFLNYSPPRDARV